MNTDELRAEYLKSDETETQWMDRLWDENRKIEEERNEARQERDKYAGLLCDAMDWIYLLDDQDERPSDARTQMISAFEALELTPANGNC